MSDHTQVPLESADDPFFDLDPHPTIRVDWLAITFFTLDNEAIMEAVSDILGILDPTVWQMRKSGLKSYKKSWEGPHGIILAFSPGRPDRHLLIRGKACASISTEQMDALLDLARRMGKVTRLDLALDDHDKRIGCSEVLASFNGPTAVTHAKSAHIHEGRTRQGQLMGETLQIGKKTGRCYLKVYDKDLESGGLIAAIRWELTLKDDLAKEAILLHFEGNSLGMVFTAFLTRFLDFRETGKGPARDRPRCACFAELVGAAEKAQVPQPERPATLSRILPWFWNQVAPWLGVIMEICAGRPDATRQVLGLDSAKVRRKAAHRKALAEGMEGLEEAMRKNGRDSILNPPILPPAPCSDPRSPVTVDVGGATATDVDGDGAKGVPHSP